MIRPRPTTHISNQDQEKRMNNESRNDKGSRSIEARPKDVDHPSMLHRALGMSVQDVEADIRRRGKTPRDVLAGFDRMIVSLQAGPQDPELSNFDSMMLKLHVRQCLEPAGAEDAAAEAPDGLESLRFYEESVAAGIPGGDGGDVPYRKARRSDFFGQQDWGGMFVTRVSGWSMREDHIADGDLVLVDGKARPKDGDIVLACIVGQGQVVKRLRFVDGDSIVLESSNPAFPPIVIDDPERVAIRGVVRGRAGKI